MLIQQGGKGLNPFSVTYTNIDIILRLKYIIKYNM